MSNCTQCTSGTACTLCNSSYYLNYLESGCVSSCNADELVINSL